MCIVCTLGALGVVATLWSTGLEQPLDYSWKGSFRVMFRLDIPDIIDRVDFSCSVTKKDKVHVKRNSCLRSAVNMERSEEGSHIRGSGHENYSPCLRRE